MLSRAFVFQAALALIFLTFTSCGLGTPTVILSAQDIANLESDADSVVARMDENSSSPNKEELKQILLNGTDDEDIAMSALATLNELDEHADLQEPIFRLMKALALNRNTPEETRKTAVCKLTHLLWHSEIVREDAKLALNEIKKSTGGRYVDRIDKAFDQLPEVLRFKKLQKTKYNFFAHPKEEFVAHPKDQNDEQRTETLQLQIASAIKLIQANKDREFIERYYDPYYFVDGVNSTSENVVSFIQHIMDGMGKGKIRQDMENQLIEGLDWSLEGRMAWAKKKPNKRPPFGTWVFRDGRWYYSMIQGYGGGFESASDTPVGFFTDSQAFPNLDFSKLEDDKARLASLRATQQKTLELAKARSGLEMYQQVLSPTILGKLAASSRTVVSTNDIVTKFCDSPEQVEALFVDLEQQIIHQQEHDPVWYLDGRIASFKRKQQEGDSDDYVLWAFFEGRWRLWLY